MHRPNIKRNASTVLLFAITLSAGIGFASTDSPGDYKDYVFSPEHPYFFKDGKVDFGTYNGFRRYHSECHVCHGPAGLGSSYAPALVDSLKMMSYQQFVNVVVRGRSTQPNFVMPSFAHNLNVLPYITDIYAYLKARSDGIIPTPARPAKWPKVKKAN